MCMYSIISRELLEAAPELPAQVCVACPHGMVSGVSGPDGRICISRLISTDPAAYLDPAFAPGEYFMPPAGSLPPGSTPPPGDAPRAVC